MHFGAKSALFSVHIVLFVFGFIVLRCCSFSLASGCSIEGGSEIVVKKVGGFFGDLAIIS